MRWNPYFEQQSRLGICFQKGLFDARHAMYPRTVLQNNLQRVPNRSVFLKRSRAVQLGLHELLQLPNWTSKTTDKSDLGSQKRILGATDQWKRNNKILTVSFRGGGLQKNYLQEKALLLSRMAGCTLFLRNIPLSRLQRGLFSSNKMWMLCRPCRM